MTFATGRPAPLAIALVALVAARSLPAQDRVTVLPEWASSPITVVGQVTEFNGRRIVIRVESGTPIQTYKADEVVHIETQQSESHQQAMRAMAAGDTARAETEFQRAMELETRGWVQNELLSWLARCARRRGDRVTATRRFLTIVNSDPESRFWGVAPLVWAPETMSPAFHTLARECLARQEEPARLIGASALLLDTTLGPSAEAELQRLARSSNLVVKLLAQSQLWRTRLAAGDMTPFELEIWRGKVQQLPAGSRSGPTYLLGRVASQRNDTAEAISNWLWLPLVYGEDEPLAARACFEAAEALARLGHADEAATLFQEVVDRYGWSDYSADAHQQLAQTSEISPSNRNQESAESGSQP